MTGTWVLRTKSDGKHKAIWCAGGFTEPDADDVYADVLHAVSMRILFAFAAQNEMDIRHVDVSGAFLYADLDKPMFIEQPRHLPKVPGMVCRLKKAIYGLRTAPRRWKAKLHSVLVAIGFSQLQYDANIYRRGNVLLSTYVDDFKLIGLAAETDQVVQDLQGHFDVKDLGMISQYLGMEVERTSKGYRLTQGAKIDKILLELELLQQRPLTVPVPDDNRLDEESPVLENNKMAVYRSVVGQLLHISLLTRPDISYAVMRLTQKMAAPTVNAWHALLACGKYLKGTKALGINFTKSSSTILASSDSSWGTAAESKSTSGIVFMLNGAPISWKAKRQTLTAQSTCESEYIAAASVATEARWLLPLFNEIWRAEHGPIQIQMDNQAAISVATSGGLNARNRHFLIREAVLKEALRDRVITIEYTPTDKVIADGFTKALQRIKHDAFIHMLLLS